MRTGAGIIIRSQELGGRQVALGADAARGIVVEQPSFAADGWGSSSGAFTLKRNPRVQWPDLRALAPIVVEEHGRPVWLGRIRQTPMTDGGLARQISVSCEGQQFHLDDDMYQRTYTLTDLSRFVDGRTKLAVPLVNNRTGPVVASDKAGCITVSFPKGYVATTGEAVGVVCDLGPTTPGARTLYVNWAAAAGGQSDAGFYMRGSDSPYWGTVATEDAYTNNMAALSAAGGPAWNGGSFTIPHRYICLFLYYSGTGGPFANDQTLRINQVLVGTDTTYTDATPQSVVKASTIMLDGLSRATTLLSADRSRITATSFNIPEFDMSAPATAREVISAANAYHGYQFRVRADNVPEYRALPSVPILEVGSESRFDEASAGDASDVYARVIVQYTDAGGVAQELVANQPVTTASYERSPVQLTNPGAETNLVGWSPNTGPVTRETAFAFEGSCSFRFVPGAGASISSFFTDETQAPPLTGPLVTGRRYRLVFWVYANGAFIVGQEPYGYWFDDGTLASGFDGTFSWGTIPVGAWTRVTLDFVAQSKTGFHLQHRSLSTAALSTIYIDGHVLYEASPTIVEKWGVRRTKVLATNMALTTAGAQQIADVFLAAHRTTPLKGKLVVGARGAVRRGGVRVSSAELLTCTGELVRMRHLVDPETGKLGRIGRIAAVSWDAEADTATLEIDSSSSNFEALLQRLAVVTGQVRA